METRYNKDIYYYIRVYIYIYTCISVCGLRNFTWCNTICIKFLISIFQITESRVTSACKRSVIVGVGLYGIHVSYASPLMSTLIWNTDIIIVVKSIWIWLGFSTDSDVTCIHVNCARNINMVNKITIHSFMNNVCWTFILYLSTTINWMNSANVLTYGIWLSHMPDNRRPCATYHLYISLHLIFSLRLSSPKGLLF